MEYFSGKLMTLASYASKSSKLGSSVALTGRESLSLPSSASSPVFCSEWLIVWPGEGRKLADLLFQTEMKKLQTNTRIFRIEIAPPKRLTDDVDRENYKDYA